MAEGGLFVLRKGKGYMGNFFEGCEQYELWRYIETELMGPTLLWQAGWMAYAVG